MQIGIEHVAKLETNTKAAEALRVGHSKHSDSPEMAVRYAFDWLEEQNAAVPAIGSVDLFGDTQTADSWHAEVSSINAAAVRVREIGRILGVTILTDD